MAIDPSPTSGGSSAATTPRNTQNESRNTSGKAISSARLRSDSTVSATWRPATAGPPRITPGSSANASSRRLVPPSERCSSAVNHPSTTSPTARVRATDGSEPIRRATTAGSPSTTTATMPGSGRSPVASASVLQARALSDEGSSNWFEPPCILAIAVEPIASARSVKRPASATIGLARRAMNEVTSPGKQQRAPPGRTRPVVSARRGLRWPRRSFLSNRPAMRRRAPARRQVRASLGDADGCCATPPGGRDRKRRDRAQRDDRRSHVHRRDGAVGERLRAVVPADPGEDGGQHGDAEHAAELADRVVGSRRLAFLLRPHGREDDVRHGREEQRHPDARQDERDDQLAVRDGRGGDRGDPAESDGLEREPRPEDQPRVDPVGHRPGDRAR